MSKKVNLEKIERIAQKHKLNNKQKALMITHIQEPTKSGYKAAREVGYTHNTARTNPLAKPNLRSALVEYIRGGNLDSRVQRHYDEALDLSVEDGITLEDKLSIISTKTQVVKEIHKIAGHYSPVKHDTRSIAIKLPNMDDDE